MNKSNKKPFIPRDKPKSLVIFILSGLSGILITGPIMFIAMYLEIGILKSIGTILFYICWLIAALTFLVFVAGMLTDKYRNIQEQDWNKQLW